MKMQIESLDTDRSRQCFSNQGSRFYGEASANDLNKGIYSSLDSTKRQIRLLSIPKNRIWNRLSRTFRISSVAQCTLVTRSLDDDDFEYDALSYAWGDPNYRVPITVNGQQCLVTRNLFHALKTLPNNDFVSTYLWVDAICINQHDLDERGHQVGMMGDLYRQAKTVHVWLGHEAPLTKRSFEAVEKLSYGELEVSDVVSDNDIVRGLTDLTSRPWFSRLWVVQEVIVATSCLVHCGRAMLSFQQLMKAIRAIHFYILYSTHTRNMDLENRITAPFYIFTFQDQSLKDQSAIWRIVRLLYWGYNKNASDPRDRIQALLGLIPASVGITPTYKTTIEDVYRSSTVRLLVWAQSLSLLCLVRLVEDTCQPSWVPNFAGQSLLPRYHEYNASRSLPPFIREQTPGRLHVHAFFVGQVVLVGVSCPQLSSIFADDKESIRQVYLNWNSLALRALDEREDNVTIIRDRLWKVITYDLLVSDGGQKRSSFDASRLGLDSIEAWISDENAKISDSTIKQIQINVAPSMSRGSFFVTDCNRFGITAGRIHKGDVVTVLAGSKVPFVLRPAQQGNQTCYQVVAWCYCEGLMNGEAISSPSDSDTTPTTFECGFEEIVLI